MKKPSKEVMQLAIDTLKKIISGCEALHHHAEDQTKLLELFTAIFGEQDAPELLRYFIDLEHTDVACWTRSLSFGTSNIISKLLNWIGFDESDIEEALREMFSNFCNLQPRDQESLDTLLKGLSAPPKNYIKTNVDSTLFIRTGKEWFDFFMQAPVYVQEAITNKACQDDFKN